MKLKKWIVPVCAISLFFTACMKTNDNGFNQQQQNQLDDQKIQAYLSANSITAQKDTFGIYYVVDSIGTGDSLHLQDSVMVQYSAKLLDGTVIDHTDTTRTFLLSGLIPAWQIELPRINAGGNIHIFSPSYWAYGYYGRPPVVPSNAVLVFNIHLVGVKHN